MVKLTPITAHKKDLKMFLETVKLAIQAIYANLLRSFLTVLGVIIGVAAVIAMVTIGQGASDSVTAEVEMQGTNTLFLIATPDKTGGPAIAFKDADVDTLINELLEVDVAAPFGKWSMTAIFGNQNHTTETTGTDNRYITASNWDMNIGRLFSHSEERSGAAVCILGSTVRKELFGTSNPIGETIRLGKLSCKIIGALTTRGGSGLGKDQDNVVLIPMRTFQRRVSGNRNIYAIFIALQKNTRNASGVNAVQTLMRERRRISPDEEDNFDIISMDQVAEMLTGVTSILTNLLAAIAGVSLLVGGIGIMNIMLVSVTERTREIGIRMALGAQAHQVMMQFLVEAVTLSLLGGAIGILVGLALAALAVNLMGIPFSPSPAIAVLAFVFSACVGIGFGYFPARKAAHLDPIEALRHQ